MSCTLCGHVSNVRGTSFACARGFVRREGDLLLHVSISCRGCFVEQLPFAAVQHCSCSSCVPCNGNILRAYGLAATSADNDSAASCVVTSTFMRWPCWFGVNDLRSSTVADKCFIQVAWRHVLRCATRLSCGFEYRPHIQDRCSQATLKLAAIYIQNMPNGRAVRVATPRRLHNTHGNKPLPHDLLLYRWRQ